METAGLVIGVAGLATAYSSCVQCWGYISAARAFSQDFAIQHMKLDIEKTLFLQWGQLVGIITAEDEGEAVLDPRISSAGDLQTAVFSVLLALKKLLTDSDELCLKYGIVLEDTPGEIETDVNRQERLSLNPMRAFEGWQDRIRARQNDTSMWRKTRWACRDRDKFVAFINEISYFNSKLQSLTPSPRFVQDLAVRQSIDQLRSDLATLRLVRDASANWHRDWSDAASEQILLTEASSPTIRSTGDGVGGFEFVHSWQENITQTERPPQEPDLVVVGENLLRRIQTQADMCSRLPDILKGCFHTPYVNLGKSNVSYVVRTKLDIHGARLKGLKFTSSQYEVLTAGIGGWERQCQQVKTLVESKVRDMGSWWNNTSIGNMAGDRDNEQKGATDLEAAIKALDYSLEFVINSAR